MGQAAVIQQPGKVELHAIPDGVPPTYLRFMRPKKPLYVTMREYEDISPTASIDIETIKLVRHRVVGLSVRIAYWPDSWQDAWAIEELLKWEGRESEIRHDKYYADFIVQENQPENSDELAALESEPLRGSRSTDEPVVLVVRESVRGRSLDSGADGYSGNRDLLSLERGVSSGHASDLSGEDEA